MTTPRLSKVSWTPDLLAAFITTVAARPDTWDDAAAADPVGFLLVLTGDPRNVFYASETGRTWVWFTDIVPGASAQVHVVCRERGLAGQDDSLRSVLREFVAEYQIHRVQALVPSELRGSVRAAGRVLCPEGLLRGAFRRRGRWIDGVLFSILEEELFDESAEEASYATADASAG